MHSIKDMENMADRESNGLEMKYFVLNPNKKDIYGDASRYAMRAYANLIIKVNPKLADNLSRWVEGIEENL